MSRKLLAAATAAAVVVASSAALADADEFGALFAFGDSLTDTGNLFALSAGNEPPAPPYFDGRFSNGPVWIESFAPRLDLDIDFGMPFAGNFAIGGAFTDANGVAGPGTGVQSQIGLFLNSAGASNSGEDRHRPTDVRYGRDDDDDDDDEDDDDDDRRSAIGEEDLVVVWAGANDYVLGGVTDPTGPIGNIGNAVRQLQRAGGEQFLLLNLPDLGNTPLGQATNPDGLNQLTRAHNAALAGSVRQLERRLDVDITVVDVNALFADILARPGHFGFANVTIPCLGLDRQPTGACPTEAAADATLFWDVLHPTRAAHAILAEVAADTLVTEQDGPRTVRAQRDAAVLMSSAQLGAAMTRLREVRRRPRQFDMLGNRFAAPGRDDDDAGAGAGDQFAALGLTTAQALPPSREAALSFFIYGDDTSGAWDRDGQIGFDYGMSITATGIDYRMSDTLLVGIVFGSGDGSTNLYDDAGTVSLDSEAVTAFGSVTDDRYFVDAAIGFSNDRYDDIDRGTGSRLYPQANGETDGTSLYAAVEGGYTVDQGSWTFGPIAGLRFSRSEIDGYTETGAGPLNLTVSDQRDDSLVGSLGFRGAAKVDSRLGPIFSRLSLTFEHEFRANDHLVVTGLSGGGENGYYADSTKVDVMKLDAAFAMQMSEAVTGYFDYGAEMDMGTGTEHEVALRLKFAF